MIKVDKKFYESGCTMDGKGNRVFLRNKEGNAELEMEFVGNTVKVFGWYVPSIFSFKEIEKISVINGAKGAFPNIEIKD